MQGAPSNGTSVRRAVRGRWLRSLAGAATALVAASGLAACGGGSSGGAPTLTWYTNPDSGGQAEIAQRCTAASGGRYRLVTADLPRDSPSQREQLVRRLAARDGSIDIMSLDPPYIPEFASAGFLAPMPADLAQRKSRGVVQSAIEGSTWNGKLVTVPFWANTQLLWYRKSVVKAAGLDMGQPVTWDQILKAAQQTHTTVSAQGKRSESLTVWLNALIESAGGKIIATNSANPDDIRLGLASDAGRRAAQVIQEVARSGVTGPAFSTANEDSNATQFEGPTAGFMVNWPFVWTRANTAVKAGTLKAAVPADYGWALYPSVDPGRQSAPPYGGINLGVGAFSRHADLAYQATDCITSDQNQAYYFASNGNPAASVAVYSDPQVVQAFPMAQTILQSLQHAKPRPQTPYYSEVSGGIQRDYHAPESVDPNTTPQKATDLISAVLRGDELL